MGNEKRISRSIRVEPGKLELIRGMHGSLQKWFDIRVGAEFANVHEATVVKAGKKKAKSKESITVDDF